MINDHQNQRGGTKIKHRHNPDHPRSREFGVRSHSQMRKPIFTKPIYTQYIALVVIKLLQDQYIRVQHKLLIHNALVISSFRKPITNIQKTNLVRAEKLYSKKTDLTLIRYCGHFLMKAEGGAMNYKRDVSVVYRLPGDPLPSLWCERVPE